MDTSSNEDFTGADYSDYPDNQGDHIGFTRESFPVPSTSTSDPGPNYSTAISRNQYNVSRGGDSGYYLNHNRGRRASESDTIEPGNRPRTMFTFSTSGIADLSQVGNFSPPQSPLSFFSTRENSQEELVGNRSSEFPSFQKPNQLTITSHIDNHLAWNANGDTVSDQTIGCTVNPRGFITLHLNPYVRVDMSVNRAIRIQHDQLHLIMALSGTGTLSALVHPSGRVYQYGSRVEVSVLDRNHNEDKIAKMWHKGISFTTDSCALVYLVDSAGIRTTTDVFSDLTGDISVPVFNEESLMGSEYIERCMEYLRSSNFWISNNGTENWIFNGIRISCSTNGIIRINRSNNKYTLHIKPASSVAVLQTPFVHTTASIGTQHSMFVKRGERRLHYDGQSFVVRNGGHSGGFDFRNKVKVF